MQMLEVEDEGEAGVASSVASVGLQSRPYDSVQPEPFDMPPVSPEPVEGNEWHPLGRQFEGLRVNRFIVHLSPETLHVLRKVTG